VVTLTVFSCMQRVDELEALQVGEFIYDYGRTTRKVQVPLFKLVTT